MAIGKVMVDEKNIHTNSLGKKIPVNMLYHRDSVIHIDYKLFDLFTCVLMIFFYLLVYFDDAAICVAKYINQFVS